MFWRLLRADSPLFPCSKWIFSSSDRFSLESTLPGEAALPVDKDGLQVALGEIARQQTI
jgi:hypothetical protein